MGENRKNNSIWIALLYILICGAIVGLMFAKKYGFNFISNRDLAETDANTENMVQAGTDTVAESQSISDSNQVDGVDKEIDWDAYLEMNSDIYAWIYVPGTRIDYPILQSPNDDDDYYLNRNLDLSEGYPGCIYTQKTYSGKDFTDNNTIIYGHNMKDGSMFSDLHEFEDSEFFASNRYFYIYLTNGEVKKYKIFASYNYEDILIPEEFDFTTNSGFSIYLDMVKNYNGKKLNRDVALCNALTTKNKIVTLSTCIGLDKEHRYLVQGVLQN